MAGVDSRRRPGSASLKCVALLLASTSLAHAQRTDDSGRILSGSWLALGPFRQSIGCGQTDDDLLLDFIAPSSISCEYPAAGDEVEFDAFLADAVEYLGPLSDSFFPLWRVFADGSSDGVNDLQADEEYECEVGVDQLCVNVVTWLATYVEIEAGQSVEADLCFGSSDAHQIWMDDRLVVNRAGCRVYEPCQDRLPVTLEAGVHRVLVGVFTGDPQKLMSLAFEFDGKPVVDGTAGWVFHGTARPEITEPPCPELIAPVRLTSCEVTDDGDVALQWENPPAASGDQSIAIQRDGVEVELVPGNEISLTLQGESFPDLGEFELCVVNESGISECCQVELLEPVALESCSINPDGDLELAWQNSPGAHPEQTISVTVNGVEVATLRGDATEATVEAASLPGAIDSVCVTNERGISSCCSPRATDLEGFITSRNWLVLGPFVQQIQCAGRDLDHLLLRNYIAPTEIRCVYPRRLDSINYDASLAASQAYVGPRNEAGRPFWRAFDDGTPDDGDNDLAAEFGSSGLSSEEGFMSWMATYVEYRGEGPVDVDLCLGVDDSAQVWFNDERVFSKYECGTRGVCDHTVPVRVAPGVHRIAMAAFNADMDWGLNLRLLLGEKPLVDDRVVSPEWIFHGTTPPTGVFPCSTGFPELCGNGMDDDGDRLVDCDDPDCSGDPACSAEPLFLRGDADANGNLEITDAINTLEFQFLGTFEPGCQDALDYDDTGLIDITDAVASLEHQFLGGAPPAAPGESTCGPDPSPDDSLDCASFPRCDR